MCIVNVTGGVLPQEEINAYIARGAELYGREPDSIDVRVDGEYVELAYHYQKQPFHRIRRTFESCCRHRPRTCQKYRFVPRKIRLYRIPR